MELVPKAEFSIVTRASSKAWIRYARHDYGRRSRPRMARGPALITSTFHNDALSIRTKNSAKVFLVPLLPLPLADTPPK